MVLLRPSLTIAILLLGSLYFFSAHSQEKKKAKNKRAQSKQAAIKLATNAPYAKLDNPSLHEDFPAMCLNSEGHPIIAYIEHDGKRDILKLANITQGQIKSHADISNPEQATNIYQPCLTQLSDGRNYCVWSQQTADHQWQLFGRIIGRKGRAAVNQPVAISGKQPGNHIFADLGTDSTGRLWTVWQRMVNGKNSIVTAYQNPGEEKWSEIIEVSSGEKGGNWEPRIAFGSSGDVYIVYDSYRNDNFDIYLTHINASGKIEQTIEIATSQRYEARAEIATAPDGKTLWITYEDGMAHWGKDLGSEWRKKGGGLHHDRQIKVVKVDITDYSIEKIADITPILPDLMPDPTSVGTGAIDVPEIIIDRAGNPWIFFRYCLLKSNYWQIAYTRLNLDTLNWTKPERLERSQFCLDRRCQVRLHPERNELIVAYPSDERNTKQALDSGIYLAKIDTEKERPTIGTLPFDADKIAQSALKPFNNTKERPRDDFHTWEINDKKYHLVWGDVHRHTDFSRCRTTDDGCIVEHYRYAIEAGGLDYLGTSDHTDASKTYSPYEWWQTQKIADLFHNPGTFVSIYAYEREQSYPYGHRNVLFQERDGPIIYIKRKAYAESPWATPLPKQEGKVLGDLTPQQLWQLLRVHNKRAITIPHTPTSSMGTDWTVYDQLDTDYENILEVFQGSRESAEGDGAPQPPIVVGKEMTTQLSEKAAKGSWQEALRQNHQLGAYASSDHRSNNVSYGGVYVSEFNRKGIFDSMDSRLTVAATDKIYMEFSCNGHLMGEAFKTKDNPKFEVWVNGTAAISKVTLIKNEQDFQVFTPESGQTTFQTTYVDEQPDAGENRYYIRIEQEDGNMGWTSPVWVTLK